MFTFAAYCTKKYTWIAIASTANRSSKVSLLLLQQQITLLFWSVRVKFELVLSNENFHGCRVDLWVLLLNLKGLSFHTNE